MNNTCKTQMCINGDCQTCQYRSNLEIENKNAGEALGYSFAWGIILTAIVLIVATTIYL
jgi:hypothetical protein